MPTPRPPVVFTLVPKHGLSVKGVGNDETTVTHKGRVVAKFSNFPEETSPDPFVTPVANRGLTDFLNAEFPGLLTEELCDGDIIRLDRLSKTYRNDGMYVVFGGEAVFLSHDEDVCGHDYGCVPLFAQRFFRRTWKKYGFHDTLPEHVPARRGRKL